MKQWQRDRDARGHFISHDGSNTMMGSVVLALFNAGLRTDEIASHLKIKESAVANTLARLRERRRAELAAWRRNGNGNAAYSQLG